MRHAILASSVIAAVALCSAALAASGNYRTYKGHTSQGDAITLKIGTGLPSPAGVSSGPSGMLEVAADTRLLWTCSTGNVTERFVFYGNAPQAMGHHRYSLNVGGEGPDTQWLFRIKGHKLTGTVTGTDDSTLGLTGTVTGTPSGSCETGTVRFTAIEASSRVR